MDHLVEQDEKDKQELKEVEAQIKKLNEDLVSLRSRQFELKMKVDNSYSAIINRYRNRRNHTHNFNKSASSRWIACDIYGAKQRTISELRKHNYPIPDWLSTTPEEFLDCLSG